MATTAQCSNPACDTYLWPGMYVYRAGELLYCQQCVRKVLVVPENVIPMQPRSREWGSHSSEAEEPVLSDPA